MNLTGTYTLYVPRQRVWNALLDPRILERAIPGCEHLERPDLDTYHIRVGIGLAAIRGTYEGTLRLSDRTPPERYRFHAEGAGTRGTLQGDGTVALEARDAGTTVVTYQGHAQLGGAVAGVGARLAEGAARTLINQFFARLADILIEPTAAVSAAYNGGRAPVSVGAAASSAHAEATAAPTASGLYVPEARPLSDATHPYEALPLAPEVASAPPFSGPTSDVAMQAARATGLPVPAPALARAMVRRAGLTDGSLESEWRIARQLMVGSVSVLVVGLGIVALLAARRRRSA
jgi:hypothetical protein